MADVLRVLILEDQPADAELALAALRRGGFRCESTLASRRSAFEAAFAPGRFDLVLADYRLPDITGLEALDLVRRADPLVPFVLVSGTLDDEQAAKALELGATDYLLKDRLARLAPAVRRALAERGASAAPEVPLTARQRQVLTLLAEGRSTKEIAFALALSVKTIETYRAQIGERLGIRDVAGLVRYAIRTGLVRPDP